MIDISVLYGGLETPSTPHRYGRKITQIDPPEHQRMAVAKSAKDRRPIVVWNLTRTCNLKCVHCYTASEAKKYPGEIDTAKAKEVLDDLADFKVPAAWPRTPARDRSGGIARAGADAVLFRR